MVQVVLHVIIVRCKGMHPLRIFRPQGVALKGSPRACTWVRAHETRRAHTYDRTSECTHRESKATFDLVRLALYRPGDTSAHDVGLRHRGPCRRR